MAFYLPLPVCQFSGTECNPSPNPVNRQFLLPCTREPSVVNGTFFLVFLNNIFSFSLPLPNTIFVVLCFLAIYSSFQSQWLSFSFSNPALFNLSTLPGSLSHSSSGKCLIYISNSACI